MHMAIAICAVISAGIWGDWRNWKRYYPTLLYILTVSMVYEFLTKEYSIWKFKPDFLLNDTYVVFVYAVISVPFTVFIFLSRYPSNWGKKILHYAWWTFVYIGVEWMLQKTGRITYEHKWSLWWSLIFDVIMFPMLRLHYKKPPVALVLSVLIISGYMFFFKVPVK
jgi:hypothetical protein